MNEEILNNLTDFATEIPIWVVILLGILFLALSYGVLIALRNYVRLIFTASTPVAHLSLDEEVELKL